ncbi:MAG: hypothetical protein M3444_07180, partial [Acidobacteriota bacterium]|nr:hypothetical protein [Acidobacteriota bacterium]
MKPSKPSSLAAWFISLSLASSALTGSLAVSRASAQSQDGTPQTGHAASETQDGSQPTLLARYATDLTQRARQGQLASDAARQAEVRQAVEILARGAKNNPVLLSETTSDAASVARGVALRVAEGNVPSNLKGARVLTLSRSRLLAGEKTGDEFVARLRGLLEEASASRARVVLFIPDFHHFLGTYTSRETSDALRAAVERGGVLVIGATTRAIYDEHIAKDASLAKLLQPLELSNDAQADRDETAASAGDKLSPEMRKLADGARAGDRVGVILQADDLKDAQLASVFRRYGIEIGSRMAQLGA